jgi:hypothetical protein
MGPKAKDFPQQVDPRNSLKRGLHKLVLAKRTRGRILAGEWTPKLR